MEMTRLKSKIIVNDYEIITSIRCKQPNIELKSNNVE